MGRDARKLIWGSWRDLNCKDEKAHSWRRGKGVIMVNMIYESNPAAIRILLGEGALSSRAGPLLGQ